MIPSKSSNGVNRFIRCWKKEETQWSLDGITCGDPQRGTVQRKNRTTAWQRFCFFVFRILRKASLGGITCGDPKSGTVQRKTQIKYYSTLDIF